MALLPTCFLAHSDDVKCNSCSPEAIWGRLTESDQRMLLSLPGIWDARELFDQLVRMQVEHTLCEVVGDQRPNMRWEPTALGRAVAEYGRAQKAIPQIWEGLDPAQRRWLLSERGIPAFGLLTMGLIRAHTHTITPLGRAVAEHGRAQA